VTFRTDDSVGVLIPTLAKVGVAVQHGVVLSPIARRTQVAHLLCEPETYMSGQSDIIIGRTTTIIRGLELRAAQERGAEHRMAAFVVVDAGLTRSIDHDFGGRAHGSLCQESDTLASLLQSFHEVGMTSTSGQRQPEMKMQVEPVASGMVKVVLEGRLDITGAGVIDLQFNAIAGSHRGVIVDLSRVSFLASIGI
jgi:hypothetical protein